MVGDVIRQTFSREEMAYLVSLPPETLHTDWPREFYAEYTKRWVRMDRGWAGIRDVATHYREPWLYFRCGEGIIAVQQDTGAFWTPFVHDWLKQVEGAFASPAEPAAPARGA